MVVLQCHLFIHSYVFIHRFIIFHSEAPSIWELVIYSIVRLLTDQVLFSCHLTHHNQQNIRLAKRKKAALETMQEADMAEELEREEATELRGGAYLRLLAKGMKRKEDDDEDQSSSSEDEEDLDAEVLKSRTVKNPLIAPGPDGKRKETSGGDTSAARWFGQALFDGAVDEKDMEESESEEEEEGEDNHHEMMPLPSEVC
jgi:hypothetical protein